MLLELKNKEKLILGDYTFKCSTGKKGLRKNKYEGDKSTPKGTFDLGKIYWRKDRVIKPETKIKCFKIKRRFCWCNDPKSIKYNKQVDIKYKFKKEKLYRRDHKYNYILVIEYNSKKIIRGKGSAIFLHLTKNYHKTDGCIAVRKKDFLIIAKLLKPSSKIKIY